MCPSLPKCVRIIELMKTGVGRGIFYTSFRKDRLQPQTGHYSPPFLIDQNTNGLASPQLSSLKGLGVDFVKRPAANTAQFALPSRFD